MSTSTLAANYITRKILDGSGKHKPIGSFTANVKPFSVLGLLATVVLLFRFKAQTIIDNPAAIAMIAAPLIIQSYGSYFIAYGRAYF